MTWNAGIDIFTNGCGFGVTCNGNLFVGVGYGDSSTAYSYDGMNWSTGTDIFNGSGGSGQAVTCNGNLFVAVGGNDITTAYSYNGIDWLAGTNFFTNATGPTFTGSGYGVTWNGTLFVAVGFSPNGTSAYSYDGRTWVEGNNQIFPNGHGNYVTCNNTLLNTITFSKNLWVAVGTGNKIYYSYNGIDWKYDVTIFGGSFNGVAWNGKLFVVVGNGDSSTGYSYDGINWSTGTNIFSNGIGVTWNGNLFVAVGTGTNSTAYSYDGKTWTAGTNIFTGSGKGVAWNGKLFVAVGYGDSSTAYSYDGKTWLVGNTHIFPGSEGGHAVTWNINLFVAVGKGGNAGPASTAYSYDGKTWKTGTNIFTGSYGGGGVTSNGNLFVAVGDGDSSTAYSYDGKTWLAGTDMFNGSGRGNGVGWNGNLFVAVGQGDNSSAYSYDGKTWSGTNLFSSDSGRSVACTNFIYNIDMITPTIAVGENDIAYSLDGNKWTSASDIFFGGNCYGVAWNGLIYVAVGFGLISPIAYSYDGIIWYSSDNATSVFGTGLSNGFNSITWNGTLFVVGGYINTTTPAYIGYSNDGINWNIAPTDNTIFTGNLVDNNVAYSVAWNGTHFVVVGGAPSKISHSTDGISWTASTNGSAIFSTGIVKGITWNGTRFVAVAEGTNSIGYSEDGNTWTITGSGIDLLVLNSDSRNCIACNGIFVAGGTTTVGVDTEAYKIIYSTDGDSWTATDDMGGNGNIIFSDGAVHAITWNGKRFIAVGSGTNKIAYSFDGITWIASDNGNSVFADNVYGVGGGNPNFGPVRINPTLTFESEDTLTFNVDVFNSNVNDISVSFLTQS